MYALLHFFAAFPFSHLLFSYISTGAVQFINFNTILAFNDY